MSAWAPFYHDAYEAEVEIKLYEHWVNKVEKGLSQADRLLDNVRSSMLENAFERRFCVTQMNICLDDFERTHSDRIGALIGVLENHVRQHQTDYPEDAQARDDEALVGLCSLNPLYLNEGRQYHVPNASPRMSAASYNLASVPLLADENEDDGGFLIAEIGDRGTYAEQLGQELMEAFKQKAREDSHLKSPNPRMRKLIRLRKEPVSCAPDNKDTKPRSQIHMLLNEQSVR